MHLFKTADGKNDEDLEDSPTGRTIISKIPSNNIPEDVPEEGNSQWVAVQRCSEKMIVLQFLKISTKTLKLKSLIKWDFSLPVDSLTQGSTQNNDFEKHPKTPCF